MSGGHVADLRRRVEDLFHEATQYYGFAFGVNEDAGDMVAVNEFKSGIIVLATLIDEGNRFPDHAALSDVRLSLQRYHVDICDHLPMKARRLEAIISEIDAAERAFFPDEVEE